MWRDEATLLDIAQAARRIVSFVRGVDEASFAANAEKHWAVVAQLFIILSSAKPSHTCRTNFDPHTRKSRGQRSPECATGSSTATIRFVGIWCGGLQRKPCRNC